MSKYAEYLVGLVDMNVKQIKDESLTMNKEQGLH